MIRTCQCSFFTYKFLFPTALLLRVHLSFRLLSRCHSVLVNSRVHPPTRFTASSFSRVSLRSRCSTFSDASFYSHFLHFSAFKTRANCFDRSVTCFWYKEHLVLLRYALDMILFKSRLFIFNETLCRRQTKAAT